VRNSNGNTMGLDKKEFIDRPDGLLVPSGYDEAVVVPSSAGKITATGILVPDAPAFERPKVNALARLDVDDGHREVLRPHLEQVKELSEKEEEEGIEPEEWRLTLGDAFYAPHRRLMLEKFGSSSLQRAYQIAQLSAEDTLGFLGAPRGDSRAHEQPRVEKLISKYKVAPVGNIKKEYLDPYLEPEDEIRNAKGEIIKNLSLSPVERMFMVLDPEIWSLITETEQHSGRKVLRADAGYLEELSVLGVDWVLENWMNRSTKRREILTLLSAIATDSNSQGIWRETAYIDTMLAHAFNTESDRATKERVALLLGQTASRSLALEMLAELDTGNQQNQVYIERIIEGAMEKTYTSREMFHIFFAMKDRQGLATSPFFFRALCFLEVEGKKKKKSDDLSTEEYAQVYSFIERLEASRNEVEKEVGVLWSQPAGVEGVLQCGEQPAILFSPDTFETTVVKGEQIRVGIEVELSIAKGGKQVAKTIIDRVNAEYDLDLQLGSDVDWDEIRTGKEISLSGKYMAGIVDLLSSLCCVTDRFMSIHFRVDDDDMYGSIYSLLEGVAGYSHSNISLRSNKKNGTNTCEIRYLDLPFVGRKNTVGRSRSLDLRLIPVIFSIVAEISRFGISGNAKRLHYPASGFFGTTDGRVVPPYRCMKLFQHALPTLSSGGLLSVATLVAQSPSVCAYWSPDLFGHILAREDASVMGEIAVRAVAEAARSHEINDIDYYKRAFLQGVLSEDAVIHIAEALHPHERRTLMDSFWGVYAEKSAKLPFPQKIIDYYISSFKTSESLLTPDSVIGLIPVVDEDIREKLRREVMKTLFPGGVPNLRAISDYHKVFFEPHCNEITVRAIEVLGADMRYDYRFVDSIVGQYVRHGARFLEVYTTLGETAYRRFLEVSARCDNNEVCRTFLRGIVNVIGTENEWVVMNVLSESIRTILSGSSRLIPGLLSKLEQYPDRLAEYHDLIVERIVTSATLGPPLGDFIMAEIQVSGSQTSSSVLDKAIQYVACSPMPPISQNVVAAIVGDASLWQRASEGLMEKLIVAYANENGSVPQETIARICNVAIQDPHVRNEYYSVLVRAALRFGDEVPDAKGMDKLWGIVAQDDHFEGELLAGGRCNFSMYRSARPYLEVHQRLYYAQQALALETELEADHPMRPVDYLELLYADVIQFGDLATVSRWIARAVDYAFKSDPPLKSIINLAVGHFEDLAKIDFHQSDIVRYLAGGKGDHLLFNELIAKIQEGRTPYGGFIPVLAQCLESGVSEENRPLVMITLALGSTESRYRRDLVDRLDSSKYPLVATIPYVRVLWMSTAREEYLPELAVWAMENRPLMFAGERRALYENIWEYVCGTREKLERCSIPLVQWMNERNRRMELLHLDRTVTQEVARVLFNTETFPQLVNFAVRWLEVVDPASDLAADILSAFVRAHPNREKYVSALPYAINVIPVSANSFESAVIPSALSGNIEQYFLEDLVGFVITQGDPEVIERLFRKILRFSTFSADDGFLIEQLDKFLDWMKLNSHERAASLIIQGILAYPSRNEQLLPLRRSLVEWAFSLSEDSEAQKVIDATIEDPRMLEAFPDEYCYFIGRGQVLDDMKFMKFLVRLTAMDLLNDRLALLMDSEQGKRVVYIYRRYLAAT